MYRPAGAVLAPPIIVDAVQHCRRDDDRALPDGYKVLLEKVPRSTVTERGTNATLIWVFRWGREATPDQCAILILLALFLWPILKP